MAPTPSAKKRRDFNPKTFLATIGEGRKVLAHSRKQAIFTQGDAADAVFYIQEGKVRLTVVSKNGKEATLRNIEHGRFFRRRGPGWAALAHGVCNRTDGLRDPAY
jgi:CRP/FNR family transcriptional regulator, cyclic AMP receptor protein